MRLADIYKMCNMSSEFIDAIDEVTALLCFQRNKHIKTVYVDDDTGINELDYMGVSLTGGVNEIK